MNNERSDGQSVSQSDHVFAKTLFDDLKELREMNDLVWRKFVQQYPKFKQFIYLVVFLVLFFFHLHMVLRFFRWRKRQRAQTAFICAMLVDENSQKKEYIIS